jgi:hypothetical protein
MSKHSNISKYLFSGLLAVDCHCQFVEILGRTFETSVFLHVQRNFELFVPVAVAEFSDFAWL